MVIIVILLVCSALGYAMAGTRKKALGAILGFFLGPFGILIAAIACKD